MKSVLILTILSSFVINSYSQSDTTLPVKIELKLIKADTFNVSRKGWGEEIKRNNSQVTTDSIQIKSFDIELSIKNTSQDSITIVLMSCSWEDGFEVNNDYIYFGGRNCNSNYPVPYEFKGGETKRFKATLYKSIKFDYPAPYSNYRYEEPTTSVGLIVENVRYDPKLTLYTYLGTGHLDKSKWRIIWSTPLYLLGK